MSRSLRPESLTFTASFFVVGILTAFFFAVGILLTAAPHAGAAVVGDQPIVVGSIFGDIWSGIRGVGSAVLGAIDWTVGLASKFLLNTLGGFVKLLIPDAWAKQSLGVMQWIVGVPNYGAQVATASGPRYGLAGVNEIRDVMLWIGIAFLPLTATVAAMKGVFGLGDEAAHAPFMRLFLLAFGLLSYTWLWAQAAAITNQLSAAVLGIPSVTKGVEQLFSFVITGSVVSGMPFLGLILMAICGVYILLMIATKVILLLVGAIVYATGPLMIGISPTERGDAAVRAWMSLAIGVLALPFVWSIVFAVAAVLMFDAGQPSAQAIIGTGSGIGKVFGGLVLAFAAIAGFWLNIKLTKAAASMLTSQVGGMLAGMGARGGGASIAPPRIAAGSARQHLSGFRSQMAGGRGGGLAAAGAGGSGGGSGMLRRGAGALAGGAAGGAAGAGAGAGARAGGARAGAHATRLARSGSGTLGREGEGTASRAGGDDAATAAATRDVQPKAGPPPLSREKLAAEKRQSEARVAANLAADRERTAARVAAMPPPPTRLERIRSKAQNTVAAHRPYKGPPTGGTDAGKSADGAAAKSTSSTSAPQSGRSAGQSGASPPPSAGGSGATPSGGRGATPASPPSPSGATPPPSAGRSGAAPSSRPGDAASAPPQTASASSSTSRPSAPVRAEGARPAGPAPKPPKTSRRGRKSTPRDAFGRPEDTPPPSPDRAFGRRKDQP